MSQQLAILGATGSIGVSTLDVVRKHPQRYHVFSLTAHHNVSLLKEQCLEFHPEYAVLADDAKAQTLRAALTEAGCQTQVLAGPDALQQVASASEVDTVVAAIVGGAGLEPTMAAVRAGKRVLLANKEALVMSGQLFTDAVAKSGGLLLPVDSEHNAIFQCLPERYESLADAGVSKIILTGSGGPFRESDPRALAAVTPEQACNHPNWSMGRKISVDSATMMNKGLEYIEACWLFKASSADIDVVVHPQSVVHSMVQYKDGSVIAQMGQPDMRTPIAHCLAWPNRIDSGVEALDFTRVGALTFEAPDFERFKCLRLAMDAWQAGKDYPAALNAGNEVVVERFLNRQLKFTQIAEVLVSLMESWQASEPVAIDDVIAADRKARELTQALVQRLAG